VELYGSAANVLIMDFIESSFLRRHDLPGAMFSVHFFNIRWTATHNGSLWYHLGNQNNSAVRTLLPSLGFNDRCRDRGCWDWLGKGSIDLRQLSQWGQSRIIGYAIEGIAGQTAPSANDKSSNVSIIAGIGAALANLIARVDDVTGKLDQTLFWAGVGLGDGDRALNAAIGTGGNVTFWGGLRSSLDAKDCLCIDPNITAVASKCISGDVTIF
jgi:hypothetical protein